MNIPCNLLLTLIATLPPPVFLHRQSPALEECLNSTEHSYQQQVILYCWHYFFYLLVFGFISHLFYIRQVHFLSAWKEEEIRKYLPYPGMPSKGEVIHMHHVGRSSVINIFLASDFTCSDFHRWIPTLLFEQLSWAIIATSIEFHKKAPPKNKKQPQKPFQVLKKETSQHCRDGSIHLGSTS